MDTAQMYELAGRMYEGVDIQLAIEQKQLTTLEQVVETLKLRGEHLSKLLDIESTKWIASSSEE